MNRLTPLTTRLAFVFTGVVCALLQSVGCSNEAQSPGTAQGTTTCSTGAPYTDDTTFALVGAPVAPLPACKPRCDYQGGVEPPGFYFVEALPSGACVDEGVACGMAVRVRCCGGRGPVVGPVNGMLCSCSAGVWKCGVSNQGAATCGVCLDGGSDAGAGEAGTPQ